MLRNDKTIFELKQKLHSFRSKKITSQYPNLIDFNDSDDDEMKESFNQETSVLNKDHEIQEAFYKGLHKLTSKIINNHNNYNNYIFCYHILRFNNFPILLLLLIKEDDVFKLPTISTVTNVETATRFIKKHLEIDDSKFMGSYSHNKSNFLFFQTFQEIGQMVVNLDSLKQVWVLPSEIMNQQEIMNFEIESFLVSFLLENPDFLFIENSNNKQFHSPEIGYQSNISQFQFLFGPILSRTKSYNFDFKPTQKSRISRSIILSEKPQSSSTLIIKNLNQYMPLVLLK